MTMLVGNRGKVNPGAIESYIESWDFELDEQLVSNLCSNFQEFDKLITELEDFRTGPGPERRYDWVRRTEDPYGAFLTRCDISEPESGPLSGVEIGVKDNIAVAGLPMTCGSTILDSFRPHTDATVVSRILDDGGSIEGKTNMDEFAFGGDESTMRFRLAHNPRVPSHRPGGSSSGSAIAVARRYVDAALGSDTSGSVRLPAAWCGVVGIKPTRGLVSHDGFVQFSKTLDEIGVLARDPETAARVLQSIGGEDPKDEQTQNASTKDYVSSVETTDIETLSGMTIGVLEELMGKFDGIDQKTQKIIDYLSENGAEIEFKSVQNYEYIIPAFITIAYSEMGAYMRARGQNYWLSSPERTPFVAALDKGLRERSDELGPTVRSSLLYAERLNADLNNEYYALALKAKNQITSEVEELFEDVDLLASSGVPMLPPRWNEEFTDIFTAMSNTVPFSLTGHPAITLPSGNIDGLPTSIQLVGPRFGEERLFNVASIIGNRYNEES